jgi:myosin heavy subunit
VVRGATKASETLGAQQLKAKYAGMRISARQGRFQRFIRDIYRIKAELIAEHFEPQVLQMISGINVIPDQQWVMLKQQKQIPAGAVSETEFSQALALVKSSKLRGFKIDVETDSTIPEDKTEEQDKRVQFITALSQYLANALPAVQQGLLPAAIAREGMLFAVRAFKVGSELEEVLEQLGTDDEAASLKEQIQQLQPQLQQAQEENQQLKDQNQQLQSKAQIEMQKAQAKAQTDQFSAQQKAQLDQASAAHSTQLEDMKAAHDAQIKQSQADHDAAIKEREAEQDMRIKELEARQDAMLKERDARQEAALKERDAQHSQALQTQQARVDQMTQQMAQKPSNIQVQPTDMTEVSDKLDTIAEGQTKVLEAILALVQSNSATRTKKGRAKLPSGGMIEFETSDGVSH